ncbi:MAG TPA: SRPBCC family protein [Gaiellaceae bacterium]|nr:SRPBCC family protein [Gaiellaceae bacterium]
MIAAERQISHAPERVFEFLSDLRNHWKLEERFLELEDMGESGGVMRLRGPLGLSRRAETRVVEAVEPRRLSGRADLRGGTVGLVVWEIAPRDGGSRVRIEAEVPHAWLPDRIFLAVGGRRWFTNLFARALANLEREL